MPKAEVPDPRRWTAPQRLRSSGAGRQVHCPEHEAAIGTPGVVQTGMTAVWGQAAWPPITASARRECLLFNVRKSDIAPLLPFDGVNRPTAFVRMQVSVGRYLSTRLKFPCRWARPATASHFETLAARE